MIISIIWSVTYAIITAILFFYLLYVCYQTRNKVNSVLRRLDGDAENVAEIDEGLSRHGLLTMPYQVHMILSEKIASVPQIQNNIRAWQKSLQGMEFQLWTPDLLETLSEEITEASAKYSLINLKGGWYVDPMTTPRNQSSFENITETNGKLVVFTSANDVNSDLEIHTQIFGGCAGDPILQELLTEITRKKIMNENEIDLLFQERVKQKRKNCVVITASDAYFSATGKKS